MRLVSQETDNGCGIACVAMLLGGSFREARRLFGDLKTDRGRSGLELVRALRRSGFESGPRLRRVRTLPQVPVGSIFQVRLRGTKDGHYLVKATDRLILDPSRGAASRLAPDYVVVSYLPLSPFSKEKSMNAELIVPEGDRTPSAKTGRPRTLPSTEITVICIECGARLDVMDANVPSLLTRIKNLRHEHAKVHPRTAG